MMQLAVLYAGSTLLTPLYRLYREAFGFSQEASLVSPSAPCRPDCPRPCIAACAVLALLLGVKRLPARVLTERVGT